MRQFWLALGIAGLGAIFAAAVEAQRFPQVMNMNTHEGKYSTGGFGFGIGFGGAGGSSFRRERLSSQNVDGALEAVFKKRNAQSMTRTIFGADIDFQIGSDNDVIGTDFGIELYSTQVGTKATIDVDNDAYEGISKNVTMLYAGFDFTINFYRSEFIESDGRRTRQDWGLALILGPRVGMMFGDFSDLNGFASVGLDVGLMADFPIPISGAEDLLSISPYLFFETNYRMGIDGALIDTNPASATAGQEVLNDNFDIGFYSDTQIDFTGDGLPDEGIAVRRHNFIPAYALNIGFDTNLTPIFVGRGGNLINNWRFHFSVVASMPVDLKFFMANYPGDGLWSDGEVPFTFTFTLGAAYFW